MAKRELLVTLGLDATTYAQDVRRANQLNKELDNSFKLLSSSSKNFENTLEGLGKKQDYLGNKMKVAGELSEVYTKRMIESKQALDETIQKSESYKKTLDELNAKKEKGQTLSKEENKVLKATQQLYDKAQKSIVTYNTRISESAVGYEKTQTALQELNKELIKASEKQKLMGKDFYLDEMRESISKAEKEFELLSNSTDGFNKSLSGLVSTQKFYESQTDKVGNLQKSLGEQIENSNNDLLHYKERIEEVNKELRQWEELLEKTDKNDASYEGIAQEVEKLRRDYTELNAVTEVHQERVSQLSAEYRQTEMSLTRMGAKIDTTREKIEHLAKGFDFDKIDVSVKRLADGSMEKLQLEIGELEDKFTNLKNEIKDYDNSVTGLEQEQKHLQQTISKSTEVLNLYEKEIEQASISSRKYRDNLLFLEQQLEKNARIGKEMLANGDGAGAEKQLHIVDELKQKYNQLNQEYEEHQNKIKENENAYKGLRQEISSMKGDLSQVEQSAEKLNRSLRADRLEREIDKISSKFDLLDSELRKAVSGLEGIDMVFKKISLQSQHMTDKINLNGQALEKYSSAIKNTEKDLQELERSYAKASSELEKAKDSLSKMNEGDAGFDKTTNEIIKLENSINKLDEEINQHSTHLDRLKTEHNNLQAEINETIREQQQLKYTMTGEFLQNFGSKLEEVGGAMQSAGMALMPLTLAIGAIGTASIKTGTEFYQSMSKVQAISGTTGAEMQKLTSFAREMGAKTIWSAKDASEALSYMGLAGWNAQQMIAGLPGVLNLASAGGTDLALTSDIVTDGLTAMRMSAEDTDKYVDIMASTMANSNTNVELMGETMKYAGSVAGGLGISMQDLSLAIGTMANSGIKGSMAGTALRGGLTRLIAPTDKAKALMDKYGISIQKTADGNVDLRATMEHLQDKMGGLDKTTQNMVAKQIFGQTAMNGWLTIINADGDAFDELALKIDNAKGSADRMAETMTDNLWGDMQELSSAVEESLISIFDAIEPMLRGIVQSVTSMINKFTEQFKKMSPTMQRLIVLVGVLVASFAPLLVIFGVLASSLGSIISTSGMLLETFGKLKLAMVGLNGATGAMATKLLSLVKNFGLIGLAVTATAVAFGIFWSEMQEDAIKSMDVITEGMSDKTKEIVEPFLDAKVQIDRVMLEMSNSNVAVTEDMVNRMEENLTSMTNNTVHTLEYGQKKSKEVLSKSMKDLMDASSQDIENMTTRIDEIYNTKITGVQEHEKAIMDIQKKAQEEKRGLRVSEKNDIQNHYEQIKKTSLLSMEIMSTEIDKVRKNMEQNEKSMNAESIADAIKSAKEKKDKIVNEANQEHQQLVAIQRNLKDDLTQEERDKLEQMVSLSEERKNRLIGVADEEYGQLISSARRMAKDSVDQIDWATGQVKSKWDVFTSGFGNGFTKILGDLYYEFKQFTLLTSEWGIDLEILNLKWQKLWAHGDEDKAIGKKIENLKKQKDELVKTNDEIVKAIDRIQDLDSDISNIAYDLDNVLLKNTGKGLAEFVSNTANQLAIAKGDYSSFPPEVQLALMDYDDKLRQAGVQGGLKQFVSYVTGDLKRVRTEFKDLPKDVQTNVQLMEKYFQDSADTINGISFEEYVQATTQDVELATETFNKLPKNVQDMINKMPKDEWALVMEYYGVTTKEGMDKVKDEFNKGGKEGGKAYTDGVKEGKEGTKQAGKELGDAGVEGEKSTKEQHKQAGKENAQASAEGHKSGKEENKQAGTESGKAQAEGTKSAKEENRQAGSENAKASVEGYKGGLKDLPQALKDELANAGVIVKDNGQLVVQDFEKTGRDAVTGFVGALNQQLPSLDGVTKQISDRLGGIDSIQLGNVTKQLSEVNRWLGVVQGKAVGAYASMTLLTHLPFGNTTAGLSQINSWLMRTSNRARDSRNALMGLTNLPFGNTTHGLSEINTWLMRTSNRSKDTANALKLITAVTYGATTKGLSEINKWLTTVKTSSNNARSALRNLSSVGFGGVTKGLSEVNRWLNIVKSTASSTRNAINAVASARNSVKSFTVGAEMPRKKDATAKTTSAIAMPQMPSLSTIQLPMPTSGTPENWLDFGDIANFKTSGDFYEPNSIKTKNNSNDNSELVKAVLQQNELLMQIISAQRDINIGVQVDGRQIAKASAKYMDAEISTIKNRKSRLGGAY